MNPKKIIHAIKDHNLDMQERLFRFLVTIGLIGFAVGIIGGMIAGESVSNIASMIAAFLIVFVITVFSIKTQCIQVGAATIGAIIIYVILPYNFITSGGIYGGAPLWMIFGVVYVSLVVYGIIKYVLLVSGFAIFAGCYYISYMYPSMIVPHTTDMAFIDSFMTLVIVSVITCCLIQFQSSIYRSENEIAQKQKKEIEDLNKTQNSFFSSMSHEIRTPINTIIGLNEMILREDVSDEVISDAKSIQGASKMLLALINDILDMSKMEAGKMDIVPTQYDVGATLSDIVNMIWIRAKNKDLKFHIDVDPSIPSKLYGDEVRIKQILINVLNNAVKYTNEGSVTLSIQCSKDESNDDNVRMIYSVSDTGIGIKKENMPYLFSAFKRVDEQKNRYIEGTGLGLSIVKQLVDLMGGDISVNSVYTKGSTFVITIPQKIVNKAKIGNVNIENKYSIKEREHYKQSFEAPKARLLIVDDNETNLMVAKKLLRDTKVNIDTVISGYECLKKTLDVHYDVIFMDHLMPEMDGIECLHALRTQAGGLNLTTPVVVLTANAGGDNKQMYNNEGFDGYLLKPVSGLQLEKELLRHLPDELVTLTDEEGSVGTIEAPIIEHKLKMAIRISTDSVSDLPSSLTDKHKISVMPYHIRTNGGEFLDGIEAETDGLLEYIKDGTKFAESESPEVDDYVEYFAEQLTVAQYVIHISMAKNASKGYKNALEAAKTFDNVYVIDSGHLSSGMGLIVLQAAAYAESGMAPDSIIENLQILKNKTRTSFIVDDTKYLMHSGRISARVSTLCEALMLHPVVILKNSSMKVGSILAGTRESVRKRYIKSCLNTVRPIDTKTLFITHSGLSKEELKWIEEEVCKKVTFENVIYQKASPAISTNCGMGCFGLLFMLK